MKDYLEELERFKDIKEIADLRGTLKRVVLKPLLQSSCGGTLVTHHLAQLPERREILYPAGGHASIVSQEVLKMKSYFEQNGGTYTQVGDHLIPNLVQVGFSFAAKKGEKRVALAAAGKGMITTILQKRENSDNDIGVV